MSPFWYLNISITIDIIIQNNVAKLLIYWKPIKVWIEFYSMDH